MDARQNKYTITAGTTGVMVVKSSPGLKDEVFYFTNENDLTTWVADNWLFNR